MPSNLNEMEQENPRNAGAFLNACSLAGHLVVVVFLLLFVIALYPSYLKPLWPSGFDYFGHIAKVELIARDLIGNGRYLDWTDQWYAGYHPLLNYPPLAYAFPVLLRIFGAGLNLAARLGVLAGVWAAAISGYVLGLALVGKANGGWRSRFLALFPAVAYATVPGVIALQTIAGEFSDFWASALAPLPIAFLLLWMTEGKRLYLALLSLSLTVIFFMHGHIATPLALAVGVAVIVDALAGQRAGERRKRLVLVGGVLAALAVFVGLTAAWWLPYFVDGPLVANSQSTSVSRHALPFGSLVSRTVENGTPRYLGLAALALGFVGVVLGRLRRVVALAVVGLVGLLMFMGPSWGPYEKIPVLGLVFAERAIPTLAVAVIGLAALGVAGMADLLQRLAYKPSAGSPRPIVEILAGIGSACIIVATAGAAVVADSSFIAPLSEGKPIAREFVDLMKAMKAEKPLNGARAMFVPSRALESFSPVLTGWPVIGGYLIQGSPLSSEIEWVLANEITKKDMNNAIEALRRWNIALVAVDHYARPAIAERLDRERGFKKIYSNRYYSLFEFSETPGEVTPTRSAFIVGDARYVREAIERGGRGTGARLAYSEGSLERLQSQEFDTIVFPGGPVPEGFMKIVENRVLKGTSAVLALDGSGLKRFMGVDILPVKFKGPTALVNTKGVKHVADATFSGSSWDTIAFEGLDEVWLSSQGRALAGIKRYGKGYVLFVGFNAFYHAAYKDDVWEKNELASMYKSLEEKKGPVGSISVARTGGDAWDKRYTIDSSAPTPVSISASWSPYWKAFLDGREIPLKEARHLIMLDIPAGKHELSIKYNDWSIVKVVGALISLSTTLFGVVTLSARRRRVDESVPSLNGKPVEAPGVTQWNA
ncbi:MAG: 6-pyruvoyl-tetrahydropterin synthase-related protein [Candidatus Aquicultorales bacterium]